MPHKHLYQASQKHILMQSEFFLGEKKERCLSWGLYLLNEIIIIINLFLKLIKYFNSIDCRN